MKSVNEIQYSDASTWSAVVCFMTVAEGNGTLDGSARDAGAYFKATVSLDRLKRRCDEPCHSA